MTSEIDTSWHVLLAELKEQYFCSKVRVDCTFLHFECINICYMLNSCLLKKDTAERDIISQPLQCSKKFCMLKVLCDWLNPEKSNVSTQDALSLIK